EKRQHVLHDLRLAADHRVAADAYELMTADIVRQEGVILYADVTGEGHVVGADDVVADLAIVRDMHADHQKVARADARRRACAARAMERHILADQIIVTDDELQSEEHTSELQSQSNLVCRLLLEQKKT